MRRTSPRLWHGTMETARGWTPTIRRGLRPNARAFAVDYERVVPTGMPVVDQTVNAPSYCVATHAQGRKICIPVQRDWPLWIGADSVFVLLLTHDLFQEVRTIFYRPGEDIARNRAKLPVAAGSQQTSQGASKRSAAEVGSAADDEPLAKRADIGAEPRADAAAGPHHPSDSPAAHAAAPVDNEGASQVGLLLQRQVPAVRAFIPGVVT